MIYTSNVSGARYVTSLNTMLDFLFWNKTPPHSHVWRCNLATLSLLSSHRLDFHIVAIINLRITKLTRGVRPNHFFGGLCRSHCGSLKWHLARSKKIAHADVSLCSEIRD